MTDAISTMLSRATDLGEFRIMLASAYGTLGGEQLANVLASGLAAAQAAGRSDLVDESEADR